MNKKEIHWASNPFERCRKKLLEATGATHVQSRWRKDFQKHIGLTCSYLSSYVRFAILHGVVSQSFKVKKVSNWVAIFVFVFAVVNDSSSPLKHFEISA